MLLLNGRRSGELTDAYVVSFTNKDLGQLDNSTKSLPDSMSIMFSMINENRIQLLYGSGPSAANLLGRFASNDEAIRMIVNDIANVETNLNKGRILAEIIHLPEGRAGNVLFRPILREFEIPYLTRSALAFENQISVQDLMVSIKEDRIFLRSKRLDLEVIPKMSTAHYTAFNALPVYQFLCDMQTMYFEKASFSFNWGVLSENFKFLPRAEYKNVILSRATWQFIKEDFELLLNEETVNQIECIKNWRKGWKIPDQIVLVEGDNELFVNFNDKISLKMFVNLIKKKNSITIREFLFDSNNAIIKDKKGNGYTNEFIAVLLKKQKDICKEDGSFSNNKFKKHTKEKREFIIGSEWIYYKFYTGVKTADKVLINFVKPLIEMMLKRKWIDKFFFIRYADPDSHIRVRLHLVNTVDLGKVINEINTKITPFVLSRSIEKIQIENYKRELERYGVNSISISESLFYIDSFTTLNFLNSMDSRNDKLRFKFAILSIFELLNDFQLNRSEKIVLMKKLQQASKSKYASTKNLEKYLSKKHRILKNEMQEALSESNNPNTIKLPFTKELLNSRSLELKPIIKKILLLRSRNLLEVPFDDLLSSYFHMMVNRIFRSRQQMYEVMIYDQINKHLEAEVAKSRLKKQEIN